MFCNVEYESYKQQDKSVLVSCFCWATGIFKIFKIYKILGGFYLKTVNKN